jgi:type IV pilus assembly protein PilW
MSIIAATYQLFYSQNKSYIKQDQAIETQQNLRAIIAVITKDLQMAGYDPQGRGEAGIVTTFPSPHDTFIIDYENDMNIIGFMIDSNGDGDIQDSQNEMIAYRTYNKSLERYNSNKARWDILSENIDSVDFVYLDQDGNRTYNIRDFKAIEVTILAKTNKKDREFNNKSIYRNKQGEILCSTCTDDQYHRRLLFLTLQFRNLNL